MKTFVSAELLAHMASPAATLAWCWIVKRADDAVFGATTNVEDIFVVSQIQDIPGIVGQPDGAVLCRAAPGINPTDIATTDTLSQSNLEVEAVLDVLGITDDDVRAGLWKNAQVEICVVNYRDLSMGTNTLFMGSFGGLTGGDLSAKIEQRGMTQPLEANLDDLVGPMCRVPLGSPACGVDLTPFLRTGTIAAPIADRQFTDAARTEPDDWWTKGKLTVTSGASTSRIVEVKRSLADGTIELVEELYRGIAAGDTYIISPGCNHLLKLPAIDEDGNAVLDADGNATYAYTGDCKVKFHNVIRFRGEPEVPGQTVIQQYGGQSVQ